MTPSNDLEVALRKVWAKELAASEFLQVLMDSDVVVPSASELRGGGLGAAECDGLEPLLFARSRGCVIACFTDKTRIGLYSAMAPYCLVLKGRELLSRLPPACGLLVNPGVEGGFDVCASEIAKLVQSPDELKPGKNLFAAWPVS